MLDVSAVSAGYDRLQILQDVSLSVGDGEIVGIIGPNGAGKSTLLKVIFGYIRPFSGTIRFDGTDITGRSPDKVMRLGISYVAQAGGLFADMTVLENIRLGGYTLADRRATAAGIERAYQLFPFLAARSGQRAGVLSGGQQQALAIARALVVNPRMLVLDEPSAALSEKAIDEIYDSLLAINRTGISMVIVEQNVAKILETAHRIAVLDTGRNAFDGTAADMRASDRIRRLYLGES
ncbi:MAG: ABC transporter ATP-binding protein [Alphaproteobacteria bacterium]